MNKQNITYGIAILVVIITVYFLIKMFYEEGKPSELKISDNRLYILGSFEKTIPVQSIVKVNLVGEIPHIMIKKRGFASGSIKKGYFVTDRRDQITLCLDLEVKPYIEIITNSEHIFFSSSAVNGRDVEQKLHAMMKLN